MASVTWTLLLISLGQYVNGEIKRVDFRKRDDLVNVIFSDNPISFSQRTPTYRCIENCLYIDNCVTILSSGEGDDGQCYLYDQQTDDLTNQVSGISTHIFNKVSVSSNDVTCLIRQTSLQPVTPTTSPSTTPPPTTTSTSTTTTGPISTYLRHYSGSVTWSEARQACQAEGGDLAMLDTPEEVKTVEDTVTGYYVLTGFYQSAPNAAFTWVDGRVVSGVNWKPGHPVSGYRCGVVAIFGVVYFKTVDCTYVSDYLCELPTL